MRKVIFSMLLMGCLVHGGLLAQNVASVGAPAAASVGAGVSADVGAFAGWWNGVL
ncbi:MAG: hypothetical protein IKW15_03470 [Bacteroidales bacterium]|nr:hypothetical protein [Bacteroidales bacterium]